MKHFVNKFKGIATKYLSNYLAWFNTSYNVADEEVKFDNIVTPVMKSHFNESWESIPARNVIPMLEAA